VGSLPSMNATYVAPNGRLDRDVTAKLDDNLAVRCDLSYTSVIERASRLRNVLAFVTKRVFQRGAGRERREMVRELINAPARIVPGISALFVTYRPLQTRAGPMRMPERKFNVAPRGTKSDATPRSARSTGRCCRPPRSCVRHAPADRETSPAAGTPCARGNPASSGPS
jgi:hypothetical protein